MLSLAVLQAISFLLTLLFIPYLTRIVGVSAFGEVVFAQIFINYAIWITNWGFYLGATHRISSGRDNLHHVQNLYNATWFSQQFIAIIIIITTAIFFKIVPSLWEWRMFAFSGFLLIIGNVFLPIWFFNALELIKLAVILQILVKLLALFSTFVFVKGPSTAWIYLASLGISSILIGVVSLLIVRFRIKVKTEFPSFSKVYQSLKVDFKLFLGTMASSVSATVVPLSLGWFFPAEALGFYNLADRAKGAAVMVLSPVTHALFPRMCYLFTNDKDGARKLLRVSLLALTFSSIFIAGLLVLFAGPILHLLGGDGFSASVEILHWLAVASIFTILGGFASHQIIIPNGYYSLYFKVYCISTFVGFACALVGFWYFNEMGAAIITLLVECLACVLLWRYVVSRKMWLGRMSGSDFPDTVR